MKGPDPLLDHVISTVLGLPKKNLLQDLLHQEGYRTFWDIISTISDAFGTFPPPLADFFESIYYIHGSHHEYEDYVSPITQKYSMTGFVDF